MANSRYDLPCVAEQTARSLYDVRSQRRTLSLTRYHCDVRHCNMRATVISLVMLYAHARGHFTSGIERSLETCEKLRAARAPKHGSLPGDNCTWAQKTALPSSIWTGPPWTGCRCDDPSISARQRYTPLDGKCLLTAQDAASCLQKQKFHRMFFVGDSLTGQMSGTIACELFGMHSIQLSRINSCCCVVPRRSITPALIGIKRDKNITQVTAGPGFRLIVDGPIPGSIELAQVKPGGVASGRAGVMIGVECKGPLA